MNNAVEEYIEGLKRANKEGCKACPENRDFKGKLPCGQQNCWVDLHKERGFF